MMTKPPLPDVEFKEKSDDGPILNIEELIEQQKKERENVFVHPPPPNAAVSQPVLPTSNLSTSVESSKIFIEITPSNELN